MKLAFAVLALAFGFTGHSAAAPAAKKPVVRHLFVVNAQHRGAVTKSIEALGTIGLGYRVRGERSATLEIEGSIRDPDEAGTSYAIDAKVDLERWRFRFRTRLRGSLGEDAGDLRDRLLEIAPFVYALRLEPVPAGETDVAYEVDDKPYRVRYAMGERGPEATVYEGLRTVGKFFFRAGPAGSPSEYDRFRVNGVNRSVLSFVRR